MRGWKGITEWFRGPTAWQGIIYLVSQGAAFAEGPRISCSTPEQCDYFVVLFVHINCCDARWHCQIFITSILSKHFAGCQLLSGRLLTEEDFWRLYNFSNCAAKTAFKMYFAALTGITPSRLLTAQTACVCVCGSYHSASTLQPDSPVSWSWHTWESLEHWMCWN